MFNKIFEDAGLDIKYAIATIPYKLIRAIPYNDSAYFIYNLLAATIINVKRRTGRA